MSLSCLNTLIGLTRNVCDCPQFDNEPIDYNTSESGYFISDEVPLLDAIYGDCSTGGFWATIQTARTRGLLDFETDLGAALYNASIKTKEGFTGDVGDLKYNSFTTVQQYAGTVMLLNYLQGATMQIKSIKLGWTTAAQTITVRVFEGDEYSIGTQKGSVTVTTNANSFASATFSTPININLGEIRGKAIYVIYEKASTGNPIDNKFSCGCGGKIPDKWTQFFNAFGVTDSIQSNLYNAGRSSYCNGLLVGIDIKCNGLSYLCNVQTDSSPLKKVAAKAINNKSSAHLIQGILDGTQVNSYTLLSREALYGKRNHLLKEYKEILDWLAPEIAKNNKDCFVCENKYYSYGVALV